MESGIERTLQRINEHIEGIGDFYDDDFLSLQAIAEARLRNDSLLFNLAKRLNKLFQQKDGMPKEEWKAQAKEIVRQETENLHTSEIGQKFKERLLRIQTRPHDIVEASFMSKAQYKKLIALKKELSKISLPDKKRKEFMEKILKSERSHWITRKKVQTNVKDFCRAEEAEKKTDNELKKIEEELERVEQEIQALK